MTHPLADSFPPQPPSYPPWRPGPPDHPGTPGRPLPPQRPAPAPNPAIQPTRVWIDPGWPGGLYDRLMEQRIVMAHGWLDGEAATRLSAQLLTLDADGTQPIRMELQGLDAELPAALSVMGVLDVVRAPVSAYAGGRISGPAIGVLAAARHRYAYPNALFVLSEPRMSVDGTVTTVSAAEEQIRVMLGQLMSRLAEVTGRDVEHVRADAGRQRLLSVEEAIGYGLIEGRAEPRTSPRAGLG